MKNDKILKILLLIILALSLIPHTAYAAGDTSGLVFGGETRSQSQGGRTTIIKYSGGNTRPFSGIAIYARLMRFDGTSEPVQKGRALLFFSSSFFSEAKTIRIPYSSGTAKVSTPKDSDVTKDEDCIKTTYYGEASESINVYDGYSTGELNGKVVSAPLDRTSGLSSYKSITFNDYYGNGIKLIYESSIPDAKIDTNTELKQLQKAISQKILGKCLDDLQNNKGRNLFGLSNDEYNDFYKNMELYYFAFEPAMREPSSSGGSTTRFETTDPIYAAGEVDGSTSGKLKKEYNCKADKTDEYGNCPDGNPREQKIIGCESYQEVLKAKVMTTYYLGGKTIVKAARSTNNGELNLSVFTGINDNTCDTVIPLETNDSKLKEYGRCEKKSSTSCTKHNICTQIKDNNGNILTGNYTLIDKTKQKTVDFVGPTLNTAYIFSENDRKKGSSYGYYLVDESTIDVDSFKTSDYKNKYKNYAIGVSWYWLPDSVPETYCKDLCSTKGTKNSDAYLQCAENYCDAFVGYNSYEDSRAYKETCIVNTCGYKYEPDNCSKAKNKTDTDSKYNKLIDVSNNQLNKTLSYCGYKSELTGAEKNTENSVSNTKSEYAYCIDDKSRGENIPIDQNKYVVIACKEESSFKFPDISVINIKPGEGVDYNVLLNGDKKCKVWIDKKSWEFYYSTYHSKDMICSDETKYNYNTGKCNAKEFSARQLLIEMLKKFNSAESENFKNGFGYSMEDIMTETSLLYNWDTDVYYDLTNTKVKTDVTEKINGEETQNSEGYKNYELQPSKNKGTSTIIKSGTDNFTAFGKLINASGGIEYNKKIGVNTYKSESTANVAYTFKKYCVKPGTSEVIDANDKNECQFGNITVESKNKFYTAIDRLGSDKLYSLSFDTTASVKPYIPDLHTLVTPTYSEKYIKEDENIYYYENEDNCDNIPPTPTGLTCSIILNLDADDCASQISDNIYLNTATVKAKLQIDNSLDGYSISYGFDKGKEYLTESDINNSIELTDMNIIELNVGSSLNKTEKVNISAIVKASKVGKDDIYTQCSETIIFVPKNTANKCSITKIDTNNDTYKVTISTGGASEASYATAQDLNNSDKPELAFKKVPAQGGQAIVNLRRSEEDKENIIIAKVGNNYCYESINYCDTCYNKEITDLSKYCNSRWQIERFDSFEDCRSKCGEHNCPSTVQCDSKSLNSLKNWCNEHYASSKLISPDICFDRCHNCNTDIYVYRPINVYNPFPNSEISNKYGYNYPIGNRKIGINWMGDKAEKYIVCDDADGTTVTTQGCQSTYAAEYEIVLDTNSIQEIRKYVNEYNSASAVNDAYTDLVYHKDATKQGLYYSEFIHGKFENIFTKKDAYIIENYDRY